MTTEAAVRGEAVAIDGEEVGDRPADKFRDIVRESMDVFIVSPDNAPKLQMSMTS